MTFEELLDQAITMLQRRGRLSYRTLQRQFALDETALEDLKDAILFAHPQVVDEEDRGLVWPEVSAPTLASLTEIPQPAPHIASPAAIPAQTAPPASALPIPEAERRQVTVLFADISGFTALAETMDPEDVHQLMNACFARLVPLVEASGGSIDKFIGDAIMALFGAPVAQERAAERAVRTALAMQEALTAFNAAHGTQLGLHCGLNTGVVIAGGIGSAQRQDYSVLGDTVNLAARLEDASERGQIFVGPETYRLTRQVFTYVALPPLRLKGKAAPVPVYEVLGVRADATVPPAEDMPPSLPLVGRAPERMLLRDRWAQVQEGVGQIVVLSGEAGIGKSRLVHLLNEQVLGESHTCLECRSSPYYQHTAFYPITELWARPWPSSRGPLRAGHVLVLSRSADVCSCTLETRYCLTSYSAVPLLYIWT